jgi:hypothetical protein
MSIRTYRPNSYVAICKKRMILLKMSKFILIEIINRDKI